MTRFGAMVRRVDERLPGIDLPLMSVSQTRGVLRRSELTDKPPRAASLDEYKICRRGDLVFNKMSIRAGAIGVAAEDGLVTYHYEVMRPHPDTDARYLVYLSKSTWFISELVLRERGIGAGDQANVRTTEVPFSVLRTVDSYLPLRRTQQAIADYLDRETAQIDALIAKQEQLVETLRERRTSVAEAILSTPVGPLVGRLKHVVRSVNQGSSPQCYPWPGDGVAMWAVLKTGATNRGVFRPLENKELPPDVAPREDAVVRDGDLVVSRASTRELVGSAAVVRGNYPKLMLSDKQYAFRLDETRAIPEYISMLLGTRAWRDLIELEATGTSASMQNISQDDIMNLPVPLPSLDHQRAQLQRFDLEARRIDTLTAKAEQFIALAKERRAALITAAITGQIDVRGAA